MVYRASLALLAFAVAAVGCAPPAGVLGVRRALRGGSVASALDVYERLRARRQPEAREALREIARATVVRAALAPERASRDAAFGALASLGEDDAVDIYERVYQKGSLPARSRAAEGLLARGDDSGADLLERALRSSDGESRAAAVAWLANEGGFARVRRLLLDLDSEVRAAAAAVLAEALADRANVRALREVLRLDPSPGVRATAARGLARAGPAAEDALASALGDSSLGVRAAALQGLARLRTPSALDRIERIASGEATTEGVTAASALASAGEERGVAYLRRSLRSTDASLRLQAVSAGGHLTALRADVAGLLADPEPGVRLRAAIALRRVPAHQAQATAVLRALLSPRSAESLQAAVALAEDGDTRARARLRGALSARAPSERVLAIQALGMRLRQPLVVRRSLLDSDPRVRVSAARVLLQ